MFLLFLVGSVSATGTNYSDRRPVPINKEYHDQHEHEAEWEDPEDMEIEDIVYPDMDEMDELYYYDMM